MWSCNFCNELQTFWKISVTYNKCEKMSFSKIAFNAQSQLFLCIQYVCSTYTVRARCQNTLIWANICFLWTHASHTFSHLQGTLSEVNSVWKNLSLSAGSQACHISVTTNPSEFHFSKLHSFYPLHLIFLMWSKPAGIHSKPLVSILLTRNSVVELRRNCKEK